MKFVQKIKTKTELEKIKDTCKLQGIDYDEVAINGLYTTDGKIISIETKNKKLQNILKAVATLKEEI